MSKKKYTKNEIAAAGALGVMQWFGNKRANDPWYKEKEQAAAMLIEMLYLNDKKLEDIAEVQAIAGEAAVHVLNAIDLMDAMDDEDDEDESEAVKADQEAEDAEEEENAGKEIAFELFVTSNDEGKDVLRVTPKKNIEVSRHECMGVISSLLVHMAVAVLDENDLTEEVTDLVKDAFAKAKDIKKCRLI